MSSEFVLTAAHCINDNMINRGSVRVGALVFPFKQGSNGGQDAEFFRVKTVFTHPEYEVDTKYDKDFALLRLDGASTITPVNMDSDGISSKYAKGEIKISLF